MTTPTTSIRIGRETHERLKEIARKENASLGRVIDDLITGYERAEFRRQMQEDFRKLREDPVAWAEYQAETDLWDQTAGDGLEDEPPYYDEETPGK